VAAIDGVHEVGPASGKRRARRRGLAQILEPPLEPTLDLCVRRVAGDVLELVRIGAEIVQLVLLVPV
jgi:hypothetical protein